MGPSSLPAPPPIVFQLPSRSVSLSLKKNVCSAGYTFNLNVIGSSTKFILHVIVLQSSLIEQPSLSWVWDKPEHEPPEYSAI